MQVSDAEKFSVLAEGERRGWPASELDAAISIESGWNPHAVNPSTNAGGLIGFMPFVLKKLGWTLPPRKFYELSISEQAPWVGRYFDSIAPKRWSVPGDTYVALAAPAFVGARDEQVVYPEGSKAWALNPGWRGPDGRITVGSIRAVVLRRMTRGGRAAMATPKDHRRGFGYWASQLLLRFLGL